MSVLDGDYNDVGPTPEELIEIANGDLAEDDLFDERDYEVYSNGSDDFSSEGNPFGVSYPDGYNDEEQ